MNIIVAVLHSFMLNLKSSRQDQPIFLFVRPELRSLWPFACRIASFYIILRCFFKAEAISCSGDESSKPFRVPSAQSELANHLLASSGVNS